MPKPLVAAVVLCLQVAVAPTMRPVRVHLAKVFQGVQASTLAHSRLVVAVVREALEAMQVKVVLPRVLEVVTVAWV